MKWTSRFFVIPALILALLSTPAFRAGAAAPGQIDPGNFVSQVIHPYFPLTPGTTFIFEGSSEGVPTRDVMTVTKDTRVILGVTTTVVHHLAFEEGTLVEETYDWFAQDIAGNVWYFGEDSREMDGRGKVISTEGSWEAGVNGAEPGIIMLANPTKGDKYQQEVAPGIAEDMAQVLGFQESLCVSYGCFTNVLVTKEWSPLEKGVVEYKYYAQGVGFIFGIMVKGGEEQSELVRIR